MLMGSLTEGKVVDTESRGFKLGGDEEKGGWAGMIGGGLKLSGIAENNTGWIGGERSLMGG